MTTTNELTLTDFLTTHGVTMSVERTDHNPHMDDADRDMTHWKVTLHAGRRRMTVVFSMGSGFMGKRPELADVVDTLASDAAGLENAPDFEQWAAEYGYDTDSRTAERTWKATTRQSEQLKRLLGDEAFQTLLWETARL